MDELKGLMQIIHTNNMEFHRTVKRSKYRVDLSNVKVVAVNQNPKINIASSSMAIDSIENETLPNTPRESGSNPLISHFEAARKRTSVSGFYTDHGPREDWDDPLNKFVKVTDIRNRRRSSQKTAINLL